MDIVLIAHNLLRWLVLLFGVLTVLRALGGVSSGRMYTAGDNKANLFFMITCDIQFLLGLMLLFMNEWFDKIKSGMGDVMKEPLYRYFIVEHGFMMIIAWILVHIGRSSVKRTLSDKAKHRKSLLFFGIALLIILASIPWPFREFGRAWLPSF